MLTTADRSWQLCIFRETPSTSQHYRVRKSQSESNLSWTVELALASTTVEIKGKVFVEVLISTQSLLMFTAQRF